MLLILIEATRTTMPVITAVVDSSEILPVDVLLGRGKMVHFHEGNVAYRELVQARAAEYFSEVCYAKDRVAREIIECVHRSGGRFLQMIESNSLVSSSSNWEVCRNRVVLKKTKQALRDVARKHGPAVVSSPLRAIGSTAGAPVAPRQEGAAEGEADTVGTRGHASTANLHVGIQTGVRGPISSQGDARIPDGLKMMMLHQSTRSNENGRSLMLAEQRNPLRELYSHSLVTTATPATVNYLTTPRNEAIVQLALTQMESSVAAGAAIPLIPHSQINLTAQNWARSFVSSNPIPRMETVRGDNGGGRSASVELYDNDMVQVLRRLREGL